MTEQQINFCKQHSKLMLSRWEAFFYYMPIFALLSLVISIAAFKVYHCLNTPLKVYTDSEIIVDVIILVVALLLYLLQKNRLNFSWIKTNLPDKVVFKTINEVAKELNWSLHEVHTNYIIAITKPHFLSQSSGERVTIVLDGDKLLINILDQHYIWTSKSTQYISYLFAAIEQEQYTRDYSTQ